VISLVLAQATDGSSILSPGAASCSTTLNRTASRATLRGWVRLLEDLDWCRPRDPCLAAGKRQEELLKLLGVARRKAVVRMGDEIGVTVVGKTKPDG
jgi:hypothetical protein